MQPDNGKSDDLLVLDSNPTAEKEERGLFLTEEEKEAARLANRETSQNIRERRRYAIAAFRITRIWVCFLVVMSFLEWASSLFGVGLRPSEYVALVTTTTGSVLGFWALVGRYLFPNNRK